MAAVVVLLASAVVFARVLLEIAVVAPGFFRQAAPPLAILLAAFALLALTLWVKTARDGADMPEHGNPAELKAAVVFGALYALVLLAVAAARDRLGAAGLYGVAALSGLTDMDAITLSTAQLVAADRLPGTTGWRVITVGALSNLVFKAGVVAALGHRRLLGRIAVLFAVILVLGGVLLAVWR
jgi:uncharacterized membrane protein (DUF4010 family)